MIPQRSGLRCLRRLGPAPPLSKRVTPHFSSSSFRNLGSSAPPVLVLPSSEAVETDTSLPPPQPPPKVIEPVDTSPPFPPPAPAAALAASKLEADRKLAAEKLEAAQLAIGYRFRTQPSLLWEALQAAGSSPTLPEGNKQLALIGDKILALHLSVLGRAQGERTEDISYRINTQASNQRLHDICDASGLTPCIHHAAWAADKSKHMIGPKTKTATVEAVIAAAHFDGGMEAALGVIRFLKI